MLLPLSKNNYENFLALWPKALLALEQLQCIIIIHIKYPITTLPQNNNSKHL